MNDSSRTDNSLTKSDLIDSLARNQNHLAQKDVELAVKSLLEKTVSYTHLTLPTNREV